jgi:SAM-dependent methyltransferase
MHKAHYKNIDLICPSCRKLKPDGLVVSHLGVDDIIHRDENYILYGFFKCKNPECENKFPIIEGVPCIIKPDEKYLWSEIAFNFKSMDPPNEIKQYVLEHLNDDPMQSQTQTAGTGSGSLSYQEAYLIGCFMDNNYGEFETDYKPENKWTDYRPYWRAVIAKSKPKTNKKYDRTLELGCSVGRYTFELARLSDLAVGLDLKFESLVEAARFQREGEVKYNRRMRGFKFEEVKTSFEPLENVLFLAGNALDPPFMAETFDLVAGLNLLDNIRLPSILLGQMNALLRTGGVLLLGSPYEWRTDICEPTEWLENESMDGPETVRNILEGNLLPEYGIKCTIESEEEIIWPLKNHDRYWSIFRSNLIRAVKMGK